MGCYRGGFVYARRRRRRGIRGSMRRIFPSAPSSSATSTCDAMNMDE